MPLQLAQPWGLRPDPWGLIIAKLSGGPVAAPDSVGIVMTERAVNQAGDAGNRRELAFAGFVAFVPLACDVEFHGRSRHSGPVSGHVIAERRQSLAIEVVL
jgi:hypothetical protein